MVESQLAEYAVEDPAANLHAPLFWKGLEDQGHQVAVFDAPQSPITGLKNGIEIYAGCPIGP